MSLISTFFVLFVAASLALVAPVGEMQLAADEPQPQPFEKLKCDSSITVKDVNCGTIQEKLLQLNDARKIDLRNTDSIIIKDGVIKEYHSGEKRAVVTKDAKTLLDLRLESDYAVGVVGWSDMDLIAWFNLSDFSGESLVDSVKFYDVENNYQELNKEYALKYKIENPVVNCSKDEFGMESCTSEEWQTFTLLSELPHKDIEIGLFTDIVEGDKIEWIIEKEGFAVLEWAIVLGTNLGFVTAAPTADPLGASAGNMDGYSAAINVVSPAEDWIITEIGWWASNATEAANFEVGVYASDDSILYKSGVAAKGTTAGWKKISGLNIPLSADTNYWVAVQLDDTATTTNVDFTDGLGVSREYVGTGSETTLPSPNWTGGGVADRALAIYALYENTVDVNINAPDGGEVIATETETYTIDFNVFNSANEQMRAALYYSDIQQDFNVFITDLNLNAPLDREELSCDDNTWSDGDGFQTTNCTYDWNVHQEGVWVNDINLVGYWPLDVDGKEFSGNKSFLANDHDGTLNGTAHIETLVGKRGGSVKLDGDSDYIDMGDQSEFNIAKNLTIMAWFNADVLVGSTRTIVGKFDNDADDKGYVIYWQDAALDNIVFAVGDGGAPALLASLANWEVTGTWHHVAGTFDGTNMRLYFDGVLVDTTAYAGSIITETEPLRIGANSNTLNRYFDGSIDEVMLFDKTLNAGEIKNIYDATAGDGNTNFVDNGDYFIDINVWDASDLNAADSSAASFTIGGTADTTPPVTNVNDFNNAWQSTDENVQFSCSDVGGVCKNFYYQLNDANVMVEWGTDLNIGINLTTDTNHKIIFWSDDDSDNNGTIRITHLGIDKTLPVTIHDDLNAGWQNSDVNVQFLCTDLNAGCKNFYYSLNDVNAQVQWGLDLNIGIAIDWDGNHEIIYWSDDNCSGIDNNGIVLIIWVEVDKTAPATANSEPTNFWSAIDINVNFSCDGNLAGCKTFYYSLDDANAEVVWGHDSNIGINLTTDTNHKIYYWSDDNSTGVGDNNSAAQVLYVGIDKTLPVTQYNDFNVGWQNFDVNVQFLCTDLNAGCKNLYYSLDDTNFQLPWGAAGDQNIGVVVNTDGNHAIIYWSDDNCDGTDNNGLVLRTWVEIDKTAPVTANSDPTNFWSAIDVNVQFSCEGTYAGCDKFYYSLDDANAEVVWGTDLNIGINLTTDTNHKIYYWSDDNTTGIGDNNEAARILYVGIDKTLPVTLHSWPTNEWSNVDVNVNFLCTDLNAGCKNFYYSLDDGNAMIPWGYDQNIGINLTTDGNHEIFFWSDDNCFGLDNNEAAQVLFVAIDKTGPVTIDDDMNIGWQNADVNIQFSCTNGDAGCTNFYYSLNDINYQESWGDLNIGILLNWDGNHEIFYWSSDAADNNEAAHLIFLAIDTNAPAVVTWYLTSDLNDDDATIDFWIQMSDANAGAAGAWYGLYDNGVLDSNGFADVNADGYCTTTSPTMDANTDYTYIVWYAFVDNADNNWNSVIQSATYTYIFHVAPTGARGQLEINADLNVLGDSNFMSAWFDGNLVCEFNLVVKGDVNISGNLEVDGNYGAYGELWQSYVATAIELPTANVYEIIGNDWNAGDFYKTTLDPDNNRIVIGENGMYLISVSLSFTGDQSVEYDFAVFINGVMGGSVQDRDMHVVRTTATNAEGAVSLSGLKRLVSGDYVDLQVEQVTAANKEITFSNINFTVVRIG